MLRELNDLEYLPLAVGQPFNVVVMMRIKGTISKEKLAEIMAKLQKRHPLLRARITKNEKGKPSFTTEKVGKIPITLIERKDDSHAISEFHNQLTTPFDLSSETKPLFRVTLISSTDKSEIIFCAQHTISDGQSMIYLVRDLIKYWVNPKEPVITLDFPTKDVDLFRRKVRWMMPKTPLFAYVFYGIIRAFNFIRNLFTKKRKPAEINLKEEELEVYSDKLSKEQTAEFLIKCKSKKVSVHSAVSVAFTPEQPLIFSPVNIRGKLKYDIGEAFGFYTGVAIYQKKYQKRLSFWKNARKLQRKLLKSLCDRRLFFINKIISKPVPIDFIRKVGSYFVDTLTKEETFSLDNLGLIDKYFKNIDLTKIPPIDTFYGGFTSILDTLVVLFYTLRGEMHFFYHYIKRKHTREEIEEYANKINKRIIAAI